MNERMLPQPHPALSVNIYCAQRIDEVIHRCIAPFWRQARPSDPHRSYLRIQRYGRGGEHLKVRLHAPEAALDKLRHSLEMAVKSYFDTIAAIPASTEVRTFSHVPAMDVEDESPAGHADRTFVWTHYRRNPIEFPGKPLLDDDGYVARAVRCLAESTERVLEAIVPDEQGMVPFHVRQNTLLRLLMASISALPWSPEHRSAYFAYHRNWLVRYRLMLVGAPGNIEKANEMMQRFDTNLDRLGAGLDSYRQKAATQWNQSGDLLDDAETSWRAAIADMHQHVAQLGEDPRFHIDPFATNATFPALFKAQHAIGNQLGIPPGDEAFAHHLLLEVSGGRQNHGFSFQPDAPKVATP